MIEPLKLEEQTRYGERELILTDEEVITNKVNEVIAEVNALRKDLDQLALRPLDPPKDQPCEHQWTWGLTRSGEVCICIKCGKHNPAPTKKFPGASGTTTTAGNIYPTEEKSRFGKVLDELEAMDEKAVAAYKAELKAKIEAMKVKYNMPGTYNDGLDAVLKLLSEEG